MEASTCAGLAVREIHRSKCGCIRVPGRPICEPGDRRITVWKAWRLSISDLMLILDELGQLEPKDAGKKSPCWQTVKARVEALAMVLRAVATWRLLFLSSGEISLGDLVTQSGSRFAQGRKCALLICQPMRARAWDC